MDPNSCPDKPSDAPAPLCPGDAWCGHGCCPRGPDEGGGCPTPNLLQGRVLEDYVSSKNICTVQVTKAKNDKNDAMQVTKTKNDAMQVTKTKK